VGFSDLYVVHSEWVAYKPGEIAHVENVLPGESKGREHIRLDEREETTTEEVLRAEVDERDSQTTDRFETQAEAQRDVELEIQVEGHVDTSGQYGPTKVDTHIGGALEYSESDSMRRAVTQARETIDRAVKRVEQRVRRVRVQRTLTRITEKNTHSLKNDTAKPVAGIYRWVDKVQRSQVFRYRNRLLLEFVIPEPAAWIRWLTNPDKLPKVDVPLPQPFTENGEENTEGNPRLKPSDLTATNYLTIASRYGTSDLSPPPENKMLISKDFVRDTQNPRTDEEIKANDPVRYLKLGGVSIPSGYAPKRFRIRGTAWQEELFPGNPDDDLNKAFITGIVGTNQYLIATLGHGYFEFPGKHPDDGEMHEGWHTVINKVDVNDVDEPDGLDLRGSNLELPVSLQFNRVRGCILHLTVECHVTPAALAAWQTSTFDLIQDAYLTMQRRYDEAVAAARISQGTFVEGSSPLRNAEVVREELKKSVVTTLYSGIDGDVPFKWNDLVGQPNNGQEPAVNNPGQAASRASTILFLEQAFEWDKLTYVLYPYFWAHQSKWSKLVELDGADPEYVRFLRSGSARVVVSARPGYEEHVNLFLDFGMVWSGGPVPAPGDPDYLSVSDEVKALQRAPDDAERLEWWDTRLPTTLVWLEGATPLPEKPPAERELGSVSRAIAATTLS
jgi:hypothetical protein